MKKGIPHDTNFSEGYVINIDKPLGWTSTDVVRKVKSQLQSIGYRKIKVGHAGTLDPLATGVLLVCTGKATKTVEKLQAEQKEYVADMVLGATTASFDMEHPVDRTFPFEHITEQMVREAMLRLTGERLQMPPQYSAKKVDGQRAYDYAREGSEVELRKAPVHIYSFELLSFELPVVKAKIRCSKGTYIRSLAMELGEELGSGAYLSSLRRTASGGYSAAEAVTMEEFADQIRELKQN